MFLHSLPLLASLVTSSKCHGVTPVALALLLLIARRALHYVPTAAFASSSRRHTFVKRLPCSPLRVSNAASGSNTSKTPLRQAVNPGTFSSSTVNQVISKATIPPLWTIRSFESFNFAHPPLPPWIRLTISTFLPPLVGGPLDLIVLARWRRSALAGQRRHIFFSARLTFFHISLPKLELT